MYKTNVLNLKDIIKSCVYVLQYLLSSLFLLIISLFIMYFKQQYYFWNYFHCFSQQYCNCFYKQAVNGCAFLLIIMSVVFFILFVLRDLLVALVILLTIVIFRQEGFAGLSRVVLQSLLYLPGVKIAVGWYLKKEVRSFLRQLGIGKDDQSTSKVMAIPERGKRTCKLNEVHMCIYVL